MDREVFSTPNPVGRPGPFPGGVVGTFGKLCLGLAVRDELGDCLMVGGLTSSRSSIGVPGNILLAGGGIGVIR